MKKNPASVHQIELRLTELSQLFNSMDSTPFHHGDLDNDAEEFLESWALEFPQDSRFRIIFHVEKMTPEDPETLVDEAIHNTSSTNRCSPGATCGCCLRRGAPAC